METKLDSAAHLITPEALAASGADVFIADCRHNLQDTEAGKRAFQEGHIPNAIFFHLDKDLSGVKTGKNGRHPLPEAALFAEKLNLAGVRSKHSLVAYDDAGGIFAARFWWLCRWIGLTDVRVLDGGWGAWKAKNLPIEAGEAKSRTRGDVVNHAPNLPTVNAQTLLTNFKEKFLLVVDARSPDRFRGENETLDPVGGHIPMAENRFFKENLTASGAFKSAAELKEEFTAKIGNKPPHLVVHQCGSGVTACHNLLAMEIAGLTGSALYPGSWSEWCSNELRPIARG